MNVDVKFQNSTIVFSFRFSKHVLSKTKSIGGQECLWTKFVEFVEFVRVQPFRSSLTTHKFVEFRRVQPFSSSLTTRSEEKPRQSARRRMKTISRLFQLSFWVTKSQMHYTIIIRNLKFICTAMSTNQTEHVTFICTVMSTNPQAICKRRNHYQMNWIQ